MCKKNAFVLNHSPMHHILPVSSLNDDVAYNLENKTRVLYFISIPSNIIGKYILASTCNYDGDRAIGLETRELFSEKVNIK